MPRDSANTPETSYKPRDDRRVSLALKKKPAAQTRLGQQLLTVWSDARAAGRPLSRADIPSRPLLSLMQHLFLLEPVDEGVSWRFRLFGSTLARRLGGDPSGLLTSQVYDKDLARDQAEICRTVARNGEPHITQGRLLGIDRQFLEIEFCHLPIEPPQPGMRWLLAGAFVLEQS